MLATILFILVVIFVVILQLKGKGWAGEHSVAKNMVYSMAVQIIQNVNL